MTVEALRPEDPRTVGPYRILGRLGSGGMGQVYLGRSDQGAMVAVKVVHEELAGEPHFRRRFRTEVEAARRVGGMWTAPVLDCDTESAVPWVATRYVAGRPLRTVVDSLHGPLAEQSVWALALGLTQALTRIHDSGVIHRDLKPSNVMVTLEGPKVIDFGIARAVDATAVTRTGGMIGSPGYMPPEQIRGEELTGAADVFALGAVLAYAATGRSPFSWDGGQVHTVLYRVLHEPPNLGPDEPAERGRLTGELRRLVARCLAKDAAQRPPLPEILSLAKDRAGTDFWLPSWLAARLGREAAALLAFDGTSPPPAVAAVSPGETTYVTSDGAGLGATPGAATPPTGGGAAAGARTGSRSLSSLTTRVVSGRRGRLVGVASGAVALALAAWLAVTNLAPAGGDEDPAAGDTTGASDDGAGKDDLASLLPPGLREAGTLTVHTADKHTDPINFTPDEDEGGTGDEAAGFELDLVEELGRRLGLEVTYAPFADDADAAAEDAVRAGRDSAHVALGAFTDSAAERDRLGVDFVNHYADGWAVMSRNPERYGALTDLCGGTATTYEDDFMEDVVRRNTTDCDDPVRLRPFGTKDAMAEAIVDGEVDGAVLAYTQAAYYAAQHPDRGLRVAPPKERGMRGIAVPPQQPELRDALVRAFDAVLDDGTYAELLRRWSIPAAGLDEAGYNRGG